MQPYIPYDIAVEERITADREVQAVLDKLCRRAAAAWNRLPRRRTKRDTG